MMEGKQGYMCSYIQYIYTNCVCMCLYCRAVLPYGYSERVGGI